MENPALSALIAYSVAVSTEFVFGQVLIRPLGFFGGEDSPSRAGDLAVGILPSDFELRHVADSDIDSSALRLLEGNEVRAMAQLTESGQFRPLKSAPTLRRGWRATPRGAEELGLTLNQLYPGAVADWFAALSPEPPVTSYRQFTERQTGMYRITTFLDDATAGAAIRACCDKDFCVKRRLWTVNGLAPDAPAEKSLIPCLEPCAVLLEFARRVVRLQQAGELDGKNPPAEVDLSVAECDFESPGNPRRVRFGLEWKGAKDKPASG